METKPASEFPFAQLAELVTEAFENYIGNHISFTAESLEKYAEDNFLSLPRSLVAVDTSQNSKPVGFCFLAVRADNPAVVRVAAMGVVESVRGKGVGSRLVKGSIKSERERGTAILELEVIQSNTPALEMYKRLGFTVVRELVGWERGPVVTGEFAPDPDLQECSISEVDAIVKEHSPHDLPWQAWGFEKMHNSERAFKRDDAYCVISNPEDVEKDTIQVTSVIVQPHRRRNGAARKLAHAMLARFPDKKWTIYPIYPGEYSEKLAPELGFTRIQLYEYQMRLNLQEKTS